MQLNLGNTADPNRFTGVGEIRNEPFQQIIKRLSVHTLRWMRFFRAWDGVRVEYSTHRSRGHRRTGEMTNTQHHSMLGTQGPCCATFTQRIPSGSLGLGLIAVGKRSRTYWYSAWNPHVTGLWMVMGMSRRTGYKWVPQ